MRRRERPRINYISIRICDFSFFFSSFFLFFFLIHIFFFSRLISLTFAPARNALVCLFVLRFLSRFYLPFFRRINVYLFYLSTLYIYIFIYIYMYLFFFFFQKYFKRYKKKGEKKRKQHTTRTHTRKHAYCVKREEDRGFLYLWKKLKGKGNGRGGKWRTGGARLGI